jgi:hypothetical protein
LLWWNFITPLEPILAPKPRLKFFGGPPPLRPAELLRRIAVADVMAKIKYYYLIRYKYG